MSPGAVSIFSYLYEIQYASRYQINRTKQSLNCITQKPLLASQLPTKLNSKVLSQHAKSPSVKVSIFTSHLFSFGHSYVLT